jgi:hypothetical protein
MKDHLIYYGVIAWLVLCIMLVFGVLAALARAILADRRESSGTQIGALVVMDDTDDVVLVLNEMGDDVEGVLFPSRGNPSMN